MDKLVMVWKIILVAKRFHDEVIFYVRAVIFIEILQTYLVSGHESCAVLAASYIELIMEIATWVLLLWWFYFIWYRIMLRKEQKIPEEVFMVMEAFTEFFFCRINELFFLYGICFC